MAERVPVPGYEDRYEIDDQGEVYSIARTFERNGYPVRVPAKKLARSHSRKGYPQVKLYANNKGWTIELHRLVCRAFHGEPSSGQEVAHLDGDKTNPAADNLAWTTRSENHQHKRIHGTHLTGERVPNSVITAADAVAIIKAAAGGTGKRALGRQYGIDEKAVRKIVAGEMWADHTAAVREYLRSQS